MSTTFLEVLTMSVFSDRLIELKAARNVRQQDIANAIGVSLRGYQYYEKDTKEPTMSKLIALADFFDVSLDYLVGRTDKREVNR